MNDEAASKVVSESLKKMVTGWSPGLYRWVNERRSPNDLFSSKSVGEKQNNDDNDAAAVDNNNIYNSFKKVYILLSGVQLVFVRENQSYCWRNNKEGNNAMYQLPNFHAPSTVE